MFFFYTVFGHVTILRKTWFPRVFPHMEKQKMWPGTLHHLHQSCIDYLIKALIKQTLLAFLQTVHKTWQLPGLHQPHFPAFSYVPANLYGFVGQYILKVNQYTRRAQRELVKYPGGSRTCDHCNSWVCPNSINITLQKEPYIF